MFSLCLCGKQFTCFPGKHELYMYSNPVFLEYRDHPQQCDYERRRGHPYASMWVEVGRNAL